MSRPPQRPIGDRPGALLGTRLSVLAAEVSDPDRFRRGRVYAKDRAVVRIDVVPGFVHGFVQGTRPEPYEVTWTTRGGADPVPRRAEVSVRCTCPDDVRVCKHAVAVLLEFADDVARQPDLLATWRAVEPAAPVTPEPVVARSAATQGAPAPDAPTPDPGAERLSYFFGRRGDHDGLDGLEERQPLTPLPRPERVRPASEFEARALDVLDEAMDALESVYG